MLSGQDGTIGAEHRIKGANDNSGRDLKRQCGFTIDDLQGNPVLDAADSQFCTVVSHDLRITSASLALVSWAFLHNQSVDFVFGSCLVP